MEIEDLETKHDKPDFIAGDISEDFKQFVKIFKKAKTAIVNLNNKADLLQEDIISLRSRVEALENVA